MKRHFLLDENVLYQFLKNVDDHDRPDSTAAKLVRLIAENCHTISLNTELRNRYWQIIDRYARSLKRPGSERAPGLEPAFFITQLFNKPEKARWELSELPEVPIEAGIKPDDIPIVGLALLSNAVIVTSDDPLTRAIRTHSQFNLSVLTPNEAVTLASEKYEERTDFE